MATTVRLPNVRARVAAIRGAHQRGNVAEAIKQSGQETAEALGTTQDALDILSRAINDVVTQLGALGTTQKTIHQAAYSDTFTPNLNNGEKQEVTLEGDITINAPSGSGIDLDLYIIQDSDGGHVVTWDPAYIGVSSYGIDTTGDTFSHFRFSRRANNQFVVNGRPLTGEPLT